MRKNEIFRMMAKRFPELPSDVVSKLCESVIGKLAQTLREGGRVEIRGFGTFFCRHHGTRLLRNPRTGELIEIPARRMPRFKAGKQLIQKVDNGGGSGQKVNNDG